MLFDSKLSWEECALRVTIKDIAAAAGVSHPTVSKALNGEPGVSDKTARHILKIARQMNYVPNIAARRLVKKTTASIGFVWPPAEGLFFYQLGLALQREAGRRDIHVMASMSELARSIRSFNEHMLDFVLFWQAEGWKPPADVLREQASFPGHLCVAGGGEMEGAHCIKIRRDFGITESMRYLNEMGHSRIGFIGAAGIKHDAYQRCVISGLPATYDVLLPACQRSAGKRLDSVFAALRSEHNMPTALILDSQRAAFETAASFARIGIRVPQDVSIIVYDDVPELSVFGVSVTTCGPDVSEIADCALNLYRDADAYRRRGEHMCVEINPVLKIRESVLRI